VASEGLAVLKVDVMGFVVDELIPRPPRTVRVKVTVPVTDAVSVAVTVRI
jgi:hypothetical protein